jgi:hypothetical protein
MLSLRDNLERASTITDFNDLHTEKHSSQKSSTDAGRTILDKSVPQNGGVSIRDNLDLVANAIDSSDLHLEKQSQTKT